MTITGRVSWGWAWTALAVLGAGLDGARAENMVLALKAVNPARTNSLVVVRAMLPKGVRPADVVSAEGLTVRYDENSGLYGVTASELLPPGAVREYRVVIRDVWTIPPERLAELRKHSAWLLEQLARSPRRQTAAGYKLQIDDALRDIEERQNRYRIAPGVSAAAHMEAYEKNRRVLDQALEDVGVLENQARGEGIPLTRILGPVPTPREKPGKDDGGGEKPGLLRIRVRNPAQSEQKIPIRRYLPREVRLGDVDPGPDLEVRYDTERDACYLYHAGVPARPGETLTFAVTITNRWTVPALRYVELETRITNVLAVARQWKREEVRQESEQLRDRLAAARAVPWPREINESAMAAHKEQTERLRDIETGLVRLEQLLNQTRDRRIFEAQVLERIRPPNRSTTWGIIYGVLAFLALMSFLFFVRWFVKAEPKSEA